MARITKTFALDLPKNCSVIGMIEYGETIMLQKNGEGIVYIRMPIGQWEILSVEDGVVHFILSDEETIIRNADIT